MPKSMSRPNDVPPRSEIPRKAFFFWGNRTMSWMRYMTLYSFRKLNPTWDVTLYVTPTNRITCNTWAANDDNLQDFFTSTGTADYSSRIKDLDITIANWELSAPDSSSWHDRMGPSHQSNFFKWQMLAEAGGIYADMDILFVRPIEQYYELVKHADVCLCYRRGYFSIGFLGSAAPNPFYKDVFLNGFTCFAADRYQSAGVCNLYKMIADQAPKFATRRSYDLWAWLTRKYDTLTFVNNSMTLVYPWKHNQVSQVFETKHTAVPSDCIGIHWYAGNKLAQAYNNSMTHDNLAKYQNTFAHFARALL